MKLPIATVTSLEVLIAASGVANAVLAVLDAGRGEVYAALQGEAGREELLLSIAEAADLAGSRNLRIVTGDANLAAKFEQSQLVTYRSSEVAARLGLKKLLDGETDDVMSLDANYIRKSEAEYMQKLKR